MYIQLHAELVCFCCSTNLQSKKGLLSRHTKTTNGKFGQQGHGMSSLGDYDNKTRRMRIMSTIVQSYRVLI
jgi:hypothetical protein